ncbi:MAG: glycosyltransferase, partial [Thermoproteota archaeon]
VSILWLNYNSSHVLDIIKASLDSIANLNYPDYELIAVDNASSDKSPIFIKNYLSRINNKLKIKFVRTNRNLGYVGGNNVAYSLKNRKSKYVVVMNNDFIAEPESLKGIVEFLENDPTIGAIQGKILDARGKIDSAGGFVDEFLRVRFPFRGKPSQTFSKSFSVSFVEGTFPLYRIDAIRIILRDFLFPPEGFVYFLEDVFVGIKLWSIGYKSLCVPVDVGKHFRGKTTKNVDSKFLLYHEIRNRVALLVASNSRLKIFGLSSILKMTSQEISSKQKKVILNAMLQGMNLGYEIYKKYGLLDIYSAPVIRCSL